MMSTAQIEDALNRALDVIEGLWPAVLMESTGVSVGSSSSDEVTALDRRISLRHEVTMCLNGWARVIVEDREIERPSVKCDHEIRVTRTWPMLGPTRPWCVTGEKLDSGMHPILGHDTLRLCAFLHRHAQWFSGHEAAPDAVEEIQSWANEVRSVALPTARDWLNLGPCPFVVDPTGHDEGATHFCSGTIRGYGDLSRDPQCTHCRQTAVVEWWEEVFKATERYVTAEELVHVIHREFGKPVAQVTIRRWVAQEWIKPAQVDGKPMKSVTGAHLFDVGGVVYDLTRRWAAA